MHRTIAPTLIFPIVLLASALTGCDSGTTDAIDATCPGPECPDCPGPACASSQIGKADTPAYGERANPAAGDLVLYEIQPRSANACDPSLGAQWQREACLHKVAPSIPYRAEGEQCEELSALEAIRLGTLDDLLEPTADYREGITLRYVQEKVGANMVWLMPLFPNNDQWALPHPCDNLGSPYAVRDYLHVRGTLARACIEDERDERSDNPCWGDDELDALITEAHRLGLRVMLDLAFNHFGHNYQMYDVAEVDPIGARLASEDPDTWWDFEASFDPRHLNPEILDRPSALLALADTDEDAAALLHELTARCPDLQGQALVRGFHMWRNALSWERERFPCDASLEHTLPGFYLGANHWDPASSASDSFTNDWNDVKFLFHHETNQAHRDEFVRNREYLFRVLNYWVSRGVDGFRLDHATDFFGGMSPNEWKYLLWKVNDYAARRGQARPIYLAEEFFTQQGMADVIDVLTEGYVFDINGRKGATKDAAYVEGVVANMDRFRGRAFVMTALETHDEHRLVEDTGFNHWTGAGFWGVGATTASTPMLLMGQEFGASWGLGFRRSDLLRARFEGSGQDFVYGDALVELYRRMITERLKPENRALVAGPRHFLRTRDGDAVDDRIFAQVKWSGDGSVVFAIHNLWEQDVAQSYYLPESIKDAIWMRDRRSYRLVDVITGEQMGDCRSGADIAWSFHVELDAGTRMQWLRLETCD